MAEIRDGTLYVGDASGGNYVTLLNKMRHPPGVWHVDVYHDLWCAIHEALPCDCEPEIETRPAAAKG